LEPNPYAHSVAISELTDDFYADLLENRPR
jgi:hypothetical protein